MKAPRDACLCRTTCTICMKASCECDRSLYLPTACDEAMEPTSLAAPSADDGSFSAASPKPCSAAIRMFSTFFSLSLALGLPGPGGSCVSRRADGAWHSKLVYVPRSFHWYVAWSEPPHEITRESSDRNATPATPQRPSAPAAAALGAEGCGGGGVRVTWEAWPR